MLRTIPIRGGIVRPRHLKCKLQIETDGLYVLAPFRRSRIVGGDSASGRLPFQPSSCFLVVLWSVHVTQHTSVRIDVTPVSFGDKFDAE